MLEAALVLLEPLSDIKIVHFRIAFVTDSERLVLVHLVFGQGSLC